MSVFEQLNRINVNGHTEKKNGLTYLSWAWAWAEVKKLYPNAMYTIYERDTEFGPVNYFTDGRTCWVKTGVNIEGLEHIEELPVMDFKNRSIAYGDVTSMDINKAIQRSLTKACARHGLGLYIYAGEDLPEEESAVKQEATVEQDKKPTFDVKAEIARIKATYGSDGFKQMRTSLIAGGVVPDIPSDKMTPQDWKRLIDAIDSNFGDAA